jgi:hypothetical protein
MFISPIWASRSLKEKERHVMEFKVISDLRTTFLSCGFRLGQKRRQTIHGLPFRFQKHDG